MAAGWVIASEPGGKETATWHYRLIAPDGALEFQESADPAHAAALLAEGARIGLISGHAEAPLIALPADPVQALGTVQPAGAWRILPRFSQQNPLMLSAGEELFLAGALAIAPKFDGTILIRRAGGALWAQISAGEVVSILGTAGPDWGAGRMPGGVIDSAQLVPAASETLSRPERLMPLIASLPARRRLQGLGDQGQADLMRGWILGAELAAAKPWWLGQPVLLISDQEDGASEVLAAQGLSLHHLPPAAALLAGLNIVAPL